MIGREGVGRLLWDAHNVSSRERVIVVDCRGFRDPTRGRWHVGVHPDNMAAFFAHPDFDPWLANVAGDFGEAVRKGSTHIVFVVYCRKGGPQVDQRRLRAVPLRAYGQPCSTGEHAAHQRPSVEARPLRRVRAVQSAVLSVPGYTTSGR